MSTRRAPAPERRATALIGSPVKPASLFVTITPAHLTKVSLDISFRPRIRPKAARGLSIEQGGTPRLLAVDHAVICAGQEPRRELVADLEATGMKPHLVGGSRIAAELDARRAIEEGARLAAAL